MDCPAYRDALFPAYAGVILAKKDTKGDSAPFPRIRGGDPPRGQTGRHRRPLFPAYAGVILAAAKDMEDVYSFPRIRGGDPATGRGCCCLRYFSPHTRG